MACVVKGLLTLISPIALFALYVFTGVIHFGTDMFPEVMGTYVLSSLGLLAASAYVATEAVSFLIFDANDSTTKEGYVKGAFVPLIVALIGFMAGFNDVIINIDPYFMNESASPILIGLHVAMVILQAVVCAGIEHARSNLQSNNYIY